MKPLVTTKTLSVVIPARNEFPNIVHTIHSIINALEVDGFSQDDFEIIIVDNCSEDWKQEKFEADKPGVKGNISYLLPRGMTHSGTLRTIHFPIAGNHTARNKGAEIARGKYLFFSDAHMSYRPGFFKHMIETIDKTGGLFHGVIAWMGAYPVHPGGLGYQYTLKFGEEWKGTWNNYCLSEKDYFHIPSLGHCSVGVRRDQFLDFGGYPEIHRTYGGGELYLDMKWWMFGSNVAVHPQAVGYHLASSRGYSYHHDDYIENVLGCAYALGADDWRERAYINWLRKGRKEVLDAIIPRNEAEYQPDREVVLERRLKTFNEVLVEQPWNKMNEERLGKSNGVISIFHDTWIDLLKEAPSYVQEAYANSKHQRELDKFINEKLYDHIYSPRNYKKHERVNGYMKDSEEIIKNNKL